MNTKFYLFVLFSCFIVQYSSGVIITHGPMIGGVSPSSARIYIRTDVPTTIMLQYGEDSTLSVFRSASVTTTADMDNSAIITLRDLQPLTDYYFKYKNSSGEDMGIMGHFKTFPLEGVDEHLIITTGSCQETSNMKVFDVMPLHHPNLFIHTGDFTYPSYQLPSSLDYPQSYESIEIAWQKRNEEPICRDMLKIIPIDYMPDDDDTWGNSRYNKGGTAKIRYENGKLVNYIDLYPRTQQMRDNCLSGYRNFFPGYTMVNDTDGYYHSFIMGNAEFFVIDTRSCNTGGWNNLKYDSIKKTWSYHGYNPQQTLLGQYQYNWLTQALKNSQASWKFIVSGVPFNKNINRFMEAPLLLQGVEFDIAGQAGTGFRLTYSFSDYWGAYEYEQRRFLKFIKDNAIQNVIVISGDTHGCAIDDGRNAGLPEMNASGLSVSSTELYYQFNKIFSLLGFDLRRWLWNKGGLGMGNDNIKNAFGKIEIFGKDSVQLCIIDEDNTTIACHTVYNNQISTADPSLNQNLSFQLFPNPSSKYISWALPEHIHKGDLQQIIISDIEGKILYSESMPTVQSIDITTFPSGEYLFFIATKDNFGVQKFIKTKD